MSITDLLKTKTILGTILLLLSYVTEPSTLAKLGEAISLPPWVSVVLTLVGGFLTMVGVRDAIQKNGPTGGA